MANATPRSSGRLCDAGRHWMDPNWENCPYCDAENRSREQTQTGRPYATIRAADDRKTRVGGGASPEIKRETRVMPSGSTPSAGGQAGGADTRRIMGVVITYTWRPEGQLFAVREGKNFIGAGSVSSEASHRDCEILIRTDPRLSSEHALILCRHGRYDIVDQKSSNGTFLNGELVPLQGTELPNYAEIKTGSTIWTFIKIEAPPVSETAPPPAGPAVEKPEPGAEETKQPTKVR